MVNSIHSLTKKVEELYDLVDQNSKDLKYLEGKMATKTELIVLATTVKNVATTVKPITEFYEKFKNKMMWIGIFAIVGLASNIKLEPFREVAFKIFTSLGGK